MFTLSPWGDWNEGVPFTCLSFLTHSDTIPLLCWQHVVVVVGAVHTGAVPGCNCH